MAFVTTGASLNFTSKPNPPALVEDEEIELPGAMGGPEPGTRRTHCAQDLLDDESLP